MQLFAALAIVTFVLKLGTPSLVFQQPLAWMRDVPARLQLRDQGVEELTDLRTPRIKDQGSRIEDRMANKKTL